MASSGALVVVDRARIFSTLWLLYSVTPEPLTTALVRGPVRTPYGVRLSLLPHRGGAR